MIRGPSYLHIATNAGNSNSVFLERCQGFVSDLASDLKNNRIFHFMAAFLHLKHLKKPSDIQKKKFESQNLKLPTK